MHPRIPFIISGAVVFSDVEAILNLFTGTKNHIYKQVAILILSTHKLANQNLRCRWSVDNRPQGGPRDFNVHFAIFRQQSRECLGLKVGGSHPHAPPIQPGVVTYTVLCNTYLF